MIGNVVICKTIANESDKEISLEHLPRGMYFIQWVQGKQTNTERVILR